jgi:hypothetical protein
MPIGLIGSPNVVQLGMVNREPSDKAREYPASACLYLTHLDQDDHKLSILPLLSRCRGRFSMKSCFAAGESGG